MEAEVYYALNLFPDERSEPVRFFVPVPLEWVRMTDFDAYNSIVADVTATGALEVVDLQVSDETTRVEGSSVIIRGAMMGRSLDREIGFFTMGELSRLNVPRGISLEREKDVRKIITVELCWASNELVVAGVALHRKEAGEPVFVK